MTRETLIGGALLAIVVGVIAFLLFKPDSNQNQGGLQQVQQAQNAQRRSILRPELLPLIEQDQQGALIVASGKGLVGEGESWRYKNSWPNPELKVQNAQGKIIKIPVSGLGPGGTLIMEAPKKLSYATATLLARKALNDPRLAMGGQNLVSKRLVARKVKVKGNRLTVSGLYSSRACSGNFKAEPEVLQACNTRPRRSK